MPFFGYIIVFMPYLKLEILIQLSARILFLVPIAILNCVLDFSIVN
jgi:hypothetical protein